MTQQTQTPKVDWPTKLSALAMVGVLGNFSAAEVPDCTKCPINTSCAGYGITATKPPCLIYPSYTDYVERGKP